MTSRIVFVCGTMFSGKSNRLIKQAQEIDIKKRYIMVFKKNRSNKLQIVSRSGLSIKADAYIENNNRLNIPDNSNLTHIFIDEAQFLSRETIKSIIEYVQDKGIEVYFYGLRTDFNGCLFEGSMTLLSYADEIQIIPYSCPCKNLANMNSKIDSSTDLIYAKYQPHCYYCFKSSSQSVKHVKILQI